MVQCHQPPHPQKHSVSGVTCFLPLLPQYWRACPSQPALLNAAHGSSVKPTSVTTPTASPSPLNAKVVQVSLVRLLTPLCMQHDPCHPPNPIPHHYKCCKLTWAVIGCLCSTSEDSYQASGDKSQPNLFVLYRSPWKTKLYRVSTYFVWEKYVNSTISHVCVLHFQVRPSCMACVKGCALL